MARTIFQIESGQVGLKIVDKLDTGYLDSWQAPDGKTLATVTLADYDTSSDDWSCQIVNGELTATPSTDTTDVPATWCSPAETIPSPGLTAYEFSGSFLQDMNVSTGFNKFLFTHDTEECYLYVSFDNGNPPQLIGRVRIAAGTMGGEARTNLTSDFTLPLTRRPDVEFGDATTSVIVAA